MRSSQCVGQLDQVAMSNDLHTEREPFTPPHLQFLPEKFKGEKERSPARSEVKDVYPQIIASCLAHLLVIQAGVNMSYSAIMLPQIMAPDSTFQVTEVEASWIASLMALATPVGALTCGPFMDLMGRKLFSLVTTVPLALSWFLMAFTPNSLWMVYLARVLAGFGGGMTTVSLVYISEISDSSWRPMLLCLNSVFVSLGIMLTNLLGVLLPWRVVALCCGALTVISAAAIALYNPESPYWLLTFRPNSSVHFNQAKDALQFLNPNHEIFVREWNRLVSVSQEKHQQAVDAGEKSGILDKVKRTGREFTKPSSVLPLTLLLVIFLFQQLSGTYPIVFYAVQVFQSIGGNFGALNADSATVLLGVIRFLMAILTAGLSRTFGRRALMITSGTGMAVSGFIAAVYFHKSCSFKNVFTSTEHLNTTSLNVTSPVDVMSPTSLPNVEEPTNIIGLVCILVFVGMGSLGFLIIPWTLIGEILPVSIRGTGGGMIFSFAYVLMFIVVKVFPFVLSRLEASGVFYFFSFTSFMSVVVVYLFLPETLGKSFEEIGKHFVRSQPGK